MSLGLSQVVVELLHPCCVVTIDMLIKFIKHAEVGARWAANDQKWDVPINYLPSALAILKRIKVESVAQIQ